MDMLFSFKNKYHYTYLNTYMFPALLPHYLCAVWNDWFGWVEARLPVKGSKIGSGSLGNEHKRDENQILWVVCVCYR